jgi:hypothetical protein
MTPAISAAAATPATMPQRIAFQRRATPAQSSSCDCKVLTWRLSWTACTCWQLNANRGSNVIIARSLISVCIGFALEPSVRSPPVNLAIARAQALRCLRSNSKSRALRGSAAMLSS